MVAKLGSCLVMGGKEHAKGKTYGDDLGQSRYSPPARSQQSSAEPLLFISARGGGFCAQGVGLDINAIDASSGGSVEASQALPQKVPALCCLPKCLIWDRVPGGRFQLFCSDLQWF